MKYEFLSNGSVYDYGVAIWIKDLGSDREAEVFYIFHGKITSSLSLLV